MWVSAQSLWAVAYPCQGSFDSSVHISEEASNAATAVPWAIVGAISVAGVLGWAINVSLAFCMGTDLQTILDNPIGQPMATIFFNSFGQKGTLAIWAIVVIVQYMMGSSMLLAASRQSFAFSRDGALPFSKYLYVMNSYTKTPVNTVWFTAFFSVLLGLLAFAGSTAINAVFSISVIALYVAYSIPIISRFAFKNDFKPGPFSLGIFVSNQKRVIEAISYSTFFSELTLCSHLCALDGFHGNRIHVPYDPADRRTGYELQRCRARRCAHPVPGMVLLSGIRWRALVHGSDIEYRERKGRRWAVCLRSFWRW